MQGSGYLILIKNFDINFNLVENKITYLKSIYE